MELFLLQYPLLKKLFFFSGIEYVPCQKSAGYIDVGLYLGSQFCFINLSVSPSARIAKPLL